MTKTALGRLAPVRRQPPKKAVVKMGKGGSDQLGYRDVARPVPGAAVVLVQVCGAGMINTEINTRLGWFSSSVQTGTADAAQVAPTQKADCGWNAATPFPFIQGTDCCGVVTKAGNKATRFKHWPNPLPARLPSISPAPPVRWPTA